jgi:hypothetical protein
MSVSVVVWCDERESEEKLTYKMQVSGVSRKSEKKILRETQDWRRCGDGWDCRNEKSLFLFKRDFLNKSEMLEWVSDFSYPVKEFIPRSGREVEIKKKKEKKNGNRTKQPKRRKGEKRLKGRRG